MHGWFVTIVYFSSSFFFVTYSLLNQKENAKYVCNSWSNDMNIDIYIYFIVNEWISKKKESNQFASSSSSITWPRFDRCDQINSCVYLHSMAHERAFQLRYELFSL